MAKSKSNVLGRYYRLLPAQWYPETNLVVFDLDAIRRLFDVDNGKLVLGLAITHELFHLRFLPYGTVLNMSNLSFRNVERIMSYGTDEELERVKKEIIQRELLIKQIYSVSIDLAEVLSAYFVDSYAKELFTSKYVEYFYDERIKEAYSANYAKMTDNILRMVKEEVRKGDTQLPDEAGIRRMIAERVKTDEGGFRKDVLRKMLNSNLALMKNFNELSVNETRRRKEIFRDLKTLENKTGCEAFSLYVGYAALDIPLIGYDAAYDRLPPQFNPCSRFRIIVKALQEFDKEKPLRELGIVKELSNAVDGKSSGIDKDVLDKFVKEIAGVDVYDFSNPSSPQNLPCGLGYKPLEMIANTVIRDDGPSFDETISLLTKFTREKHTSLEDYVNVLITEGFLPVIGILTRNKFYLEFDDRSKNFNDIVFGVVSNIIKNQMLASTRIEHPKNYIRRPVYSSLDMEVREKIDSLIKKTELIKPVLQNAKFNNIRESES